VLVVAALGGNALQRRGQPLEAEFAENNAKLAAVVLAEIAAEHRLVVTHGNGPQIGLLALQSEAYRDVRSYPLDLLGAETEGMIGYLLERELANALPGRHVASLLTQTVVDALDPAFRIPTKPIGPMYEADEAQRLSTERGWAVAPDSDRWRRVVASPVPRSIVEESTIKLLLDHDVLVVCAGGGGVPVVIDSAGVRHGVEAVVDKDAASALLARRLGADLLLLLTDVPAVELGWGTSQSRAIGEISAIDLRAIDFAPGSMGPKVAAATSFVSASGGRAAIGALRDAPALVAGTHGTQITSRDNDIPTTP
jgi:carbamate kinase